MLKEYVKQEFLDLPEKLWTDFALIEFIIKTIEFDVDVYSQINQCAHEDLIDSIIIHDWNAECGCKKDIQSLSKFYAKKEICKIIEDIEDIEYELEETREKQKKHRAGLILKVNHISEKQNLESESISFDNQRRM